MSRYYDVFNGDADGICALHQLRLARPRQAVLVSGVKRDIRLLGRIEDAPEEITVLDISMASNMEDLRRLLTTSRVFYVDHHFAGDIPESANLTAHIDPAADVCTSLIIDRLLEGRYRSWAVAAAFGDNLHDAAQRAAATLALAENDVHRLRELGELLNYNGYGRTVEDLHFPPQDLYAALHPFEDPLEFCRVADVLPRLRDGFADDMRRARGVEPYLPGDTGRIYRLPDAPWSRRVAGVFSNEKAREEPELAHALMVDNGDRTWMVSVRAPLARKRGADELCRSFPTGGGRAAAAGINALPDDMMEEFEHAFVSIFSK